MELRQFGFGDICPYCLLDLVNRNMNVEPDTDLGLIFSLIPFARIVRLSKLFGALLKVMGQKNLMWLASD